MRPGRSGGYQLARNSQAVSLSAVIQAVDGRDGRPNILIDDHPVNIREFNAKNGIGIHHTSAQSSIARSLSAK